MTRHIFQQPLTATSILIGLSLVAIVASPGEADDVPGPRILIKRQVNQLKRPQQSQATAAINSNAAQTSTAMASVSSGGINKVTNNKLPADAGPIDAADDDQPPEEPVDRKPIKKLRPRPKYEESRRDRYEDEHQDEDCDDEEYDEYNVFHSMAARPMRQFSRMMGHMFDQMQGMSSDIVHSGRPGGFVSSASASSYANDDDDDGNDGYSRTSAIVSNNGRAKGIISETRNGRTKTQRIGDD